MRSFFVPSCVGACFTPAQPPTEDPPTARREGRRRRGPRRRGRPAAFASDASDPTAEPVSFPFSAAALSPAPLASTADFSRRSMNGPQTRRSSRDARAPADRCRSVASRLCPAATRFASRVETPPHLPSRPGAAQVVQRPQLREMVLNWRARDDEACDSEAFGPSAELRVGVLQLVPLVAHDPVPQQTARAPACLVRSRRAATARRRHASASSSDSGAPSDWSLWVTMPYVVRSTPPRSVTARSACRAPTWNRLPVYL